MRVLAALLMLILTSGLADAKRVALVIGQSAYPGGASAIVGLPPLANPENDAGRISSLLKRHGFTILSCRTPDGVCSDLSRRDMLAALASLEEEAQDADVAVIYFAGHGMEAAGENVVAPLDARVDCDARKVVRGVPVDQLIAAVSPARKKLVVLDACRNDPLGAICGTSKSRISKPMGFAKIEPTNEHGLIVFTSAQFGQEALDGPRGGNSPFASAFIAALESNPHIYFDQVFNIVAKSTHEIAARQQFDQIPSRVIGGAAPETCLAGRDCVGDKRIAALYDSVAGLAQNLRTISDTDLASALRSGNIETLDLLRCDRTLAAKVASALRQPDIAPAFFRATRDISARAAAWLKKIVSCGLEPDMLIKAPSGESFSVLGYALSAGNVDAAVALLEAGATPHQHQGIWGERAAAPTVIQPFSGLLSLSLTVADRLRIAKAMVEAGIVLPPGQLTEWERGPVYGWAGEGQIDRTEQVVGELKAAGIVPPRVANICAPPHSKRCSPSKGFDWCRLARELPLHLTYRSSQAGGSYNQRFEFLGLLADYEDVGFFMTKYMLNGSAGYGLARVTKDLSTVELYAHMRSGAGYGICDELVDRRMGRQVQRVERPPTYEYCWRRIVVQRVPGKREFRSGMGEPYEAAYCPAR